MNDILDRRRMEGVSVLAQYDGAHEMFDRYYCLERITSRARERVERVPGEAFREAMANALVHRAWDVDAPIVVGMHPDRIEVTSPGGLPIGLTESDYLNGSVSLLRNPVLANVFFRLRYIEQFGTGVARMLAAYEGTARSPSFEIREGSIRVSLPVVDSIVPMDTDEERVYSLIGAGTALSRPQISELAGFGKDKTIRILGELEAKGLVRKMGSARATRYSRS